MWSAAADLLITRLARRFCQLQDCSKVVANKFFPVEAPDGSGKQLPLCETDYFRRLGLLCSKCGAALRGSYITALGSFNSILVCSAYSLPSLASQT